MWHDAPDSVSGKFSQNTEDDKPLTTAENCQHQPFLCCLVALTSSQRSCRWSAHLSCKHNWLWWGEGSTVIAFIEAKRLNVLSIPSNCYNPSVYSYYSIIKQPGIRLIVTDFLDISSSSKLSLVAVQLDSFNGQSVCKGLLFGMFSKMDQRIPHKPSHFPHCPLFVSCREPKAFIIIKDASYLLSNLAACLHKC